jgi:hypothetical protein
VSGDPLQRAAKALRGGLKIKNSVFYKIYLVFCRVDIFPTRKRSKERMLESIRLQPKMLQLPCLIRRLEGLLKFIS